MSPRFFTSLKSTCFPCVLLSVFAFFFSCKKSTTDRNKRPPQSSNKLILDSTISDNNHVEPEPAKNKKNLVDENQMTCEKIWGHLAETQESHIESMFVVQRYECPPCPPNAQCKPCAKNSITVSFDKTPLRSYNDIKKCDLILYTESSSAFEIGSLYDFKMRLRVPKLKISSHDWEADLIEYKKSK